MKQLWSSARIEKSLYSQVKTDLQLCRTDDRMAQTIVVNDDKTGVIFGNLRQSI